MIVDAEGRPVRPPLPEEPAARALAEALGSSSLPFVWDPGREGLDCLCAAGLEGGRRNRARIKIWSPRSGTVLALLYKDSRVPFSTDRFSYGALVARSGPPEPGEVEAVLAYVASGLHPERRPACVKRTFPFSVPR